MGKTIRCDTCNRSYRSLKAVEALRDNDGVCLECDNPIDVEDWDEVVDSWAEEKVPAKKKTSKGVVGEEGKEKAAVGEEGEGEDDEDEEEDEEEDDLEGEEEEEELDLDEEDEEGEDDDEDEFDFGDEEDR
ncbi:MAG TPA: hypothetical protein VFI25_10025 [Planctomycetota bacterium]|jgi:hypothetical protein|nr:hypothetical protein [Planctomycetota bacterium]